MLVPFVLDADSVVPDAGWTPAQQSVVHLALLDTWKRVGLLVYDGALFSHSRIKQSIDALPPKLAPLWQEVLERLPIAPGPLEWDGLVGNNQASLEVLGAAVKVAVVDDAKAEVDFLLREDELFKCLEGFGGLEICRLLAVAQGKTFTAVDALCGQHIQAGISYSELWATRFRALARAPIKSIAVVDRYSISQHFECPNHYLSGLERFIRLLDEEANGPRYVTVFSAWTVELNQRQPQVSLDTIAEEIRRIGSHLPRHQIKRVQVIMIPNAIFGQVHHDRFVRFGDYIWDLGIGIKVFEGPAVGETSAASFKSCLLAPSYSNVEVTLKQQARARTIEIPL